MEDAKDTSKSVCLERNVRWCPVGWYAFCLWGPTPPDHVDHNAKSYVHLFEDGDFIGKQSKTPKKEDKASNGRAAARSASKKKKDEILITLDYAFKV